MSKTKTTNLDFDVRDIDACRTAVDALFWAIRRYHTDEAARKLFAPYRPLTKAERRGGDNTMLAIMYLNMAKPSATKLAKLLASQNELEDPFLMKWGTGTTDPFAMKKQIERVLKRKKIRQAAERRIAEAAIRKDGTI
jgi:hypothetical protein